MIKYSFAMEAGKLRAENLRKKWGHYCLTKFKEDE